MYPKINSNYRVDIEKIEQFERKYSIYLPEAYKIFLSETNGADIDYFFIYKTGNEKDDYLSNILFENLESLDNGVEGDLEILNSEPMDENCPIPHIYFIKKLLFIARTNSFSLYLCYEGENKGKLYKADEPHDYEFILVANSFEEFINGFTEVTEEFFDEDDDGRDYQ